MRYAVISDIHGNEQALSAVLDDAGTQNIDRYIFLGDYYGDFPYPNEVARRIFSIKNSSILRGNKEDYLIGFSKQDPATWKHEQLGALYWNYRTLQPEYLHRYMQLPEYIRQNFRSAQMHMVHSAAYFFHGEASLKLSSHRFMKKMEEKPFTHAEYLDFVHRQLSANEALKKTLVDHEGDVYLFGHTHVQWNACISGAYLINAGSCGLPLDYDVRAPYTIIDDEDHKLCIDERRVVYDVHEAIENIRKSEAYPHAKIWYDIIILELSTATDYINRFLIFAEEMAAQWGETESPYSNELWQAAGKAWFDALGDVTVRI